MHLLSFIYHIILHQKTFQFLAAQRCWQWPQLQILPFGQLHPRGAHGQDGRQPVLWNPKTDVVLIRLQDQQSLKREMKNQQIPRDSSFVAGGFLSQTGVTWG